MSDKKPATAVGVFEDRRHARIAAVNPAAADENIQ